MLIRHRRSALPTTWLMTDERLGRALWGAVMRLPRGSGVVFRHHATDERGRQRLFARLRRLASARGLVLVRAGQVRFAGEQGVHNGQARSGGLATASAHDLGEARRKARGGADVLFLSPVFATRSHPGARALGARRAFAIAAATPLPVVALGGMEVRRFRQLRGFHGWAAIDAWRPHAVKRQKRKAVPT